MDKRRFAGDLLVAAAVLAVAAALLLFFAIYSSGGSPEPRLVVSVGGEESERSLAQDSVFTLENNGFEMTVVIDNGLVFVQNSSCPDGICVSTGKIGSAGESIICVPAEIILKIESKGEGDEIIVAS